MQQKNTHWFPGHMQKALREIEERIRVMDIVLELLDARVPLASRNPLLYRLTKEKKRLLVLTKADLADSKATEEWIAYFTSQNMECIAVDLNDKSAPNLILKKLEEMGKFKREKEQKKGMKPQPIRTMIVGIPNVGKSTLINKLAKRNAASVQNTPGHTKAQQWIRIGQLDLLDTPGVLPANYENSLYAEHLAMVGSMKGEILPLSSLVDHLLEILKKDAPQGVLERFQMEQIWEDTPSFLLFVAQKRGLVNSKGWDIEKAEQVIWKEFKEGLLGRVSLERVDDDVRL